MWQLWAITLGLAIVAGLMIRQWINNDDATYLQIDAKEFALGVFLIGPIIVLIVTAIGWKVAFAQAVSFDEYYNGWEKEALVSVDTCSMDGSCSNTYSCEKYTVSVPYKCSCDKDGNNCSTCYRDEDRWHSCPYFPEEKDYTINDTLGQTFTIGANCVDPSFPRWKGSDEWSSNTPGTPSCVGIPPFWQAASDRIAAGSPGYTSGRFSYDNFILASQQTILREYSDQIEYYRSNGLLPEPTYTLHDWYWSDKVQFVGCENLDKKAWQDAVGYLNGALGTELQGDLHLVLSCDPRINQDPDTYLIALKADWQNPEQHGDNVLSKNTVIVVIGSNDGGKTAAFGRGTTGMPIGNAGLEEGIMQYFLNGTVPFTPEAVVGTVRGEFYHRESDGKLKVRGVHSFGIGGLQDVLFGISNPSTKFIRISMSGDDADDVGTGFKYLAEEIRPSTGAQIVIVIVAFIATLGMWYVFAQIGPSKRRMYRNYNSYWR